MEKIVYVDVDGTIKPNGKEISEYTKEIFKQIQEKGIGIVLATGRNYNGIQQIAKDLDLEKYLDLAICENGSYLTYTSKIDIINLETIDEMDARNLNDTLEKAGIYGIFSTYKDQDHSYSNMYEKNKQTIDEINKVIPQFNIKPLDKNVDWASFTMIAFDLEKNRVDNFIDYLEKNFSNLEVLVSRSAHREKPLFMISKKGVTKASAIEKVNKNLNITPENTYFFGDGINDIPAIIKFKNSYVPKNAPDYVLKEAHHIIEADSDDGVAKKLKELFLK